MRSQASKIFGVAATLSALAALGPFATVGSSDVSRGIKLRAAIDQLYCEMAHENKLKPMGRGLNDFSPVVRMYLHDGILLKEAEIILKDAGFRIGALQHNVLGQYSVFADIDQYRFRLFGKISLGVMLLVDERNSDVVKELVATITIQGI